MLNVKVQPNGFPPPQDSVIEGTKRVSAVDGRRRIEIYFDRTVASRVKEQYAESVREEPDGGVVLTLFSKRWNTVAASSQLRDARAATQSAGARAEGSR